MKQATWAMRKKTFSVNASKLDQVGHCYHDGLRKTASQRARPQEREREREALGQHRTIPVHMTKEQEIRDLLTSRRRTKTKHVSAARRLPSRPCPRRSPYEHGRCLCLPFSLGFKGERDGQFPYRRHQGGWWQGHKRKGKRNTARRAGKPCTDGGGLARTGVEKA